jgi:hypothetical protein
MTPARYFDLVDKSAPMLRSDKRGPMNANLSPTQKRGLKPSATLDPNPVLQPGFLRVCTALEVSEADDF